MKFLVLIVIPATLAAGGFAAGVYDSIAASQWTPALSASAPPLPGSAPTLTPRLVGAEGTRDRMASSSWALR